MQQAADLVAPTAARSAVQIRRNATDPDQQLLVDIDLAILGASPLRFQEYDREVRKEYSWLPGFLYHSKRREVLRAFLDREFIYTTPHFRARYEQQARTNLRSAIE